MENQNRNLDHAQSNPGNGIDAAEYLWLAKHIAKRTMSIYPWYKDYDEVYSECLYALAVAANRWNPETHAAFTTYAGWYMRSYCSRYVFGVNVPGRIQTHVGAYSLDAPMPESDSKTLHDITPAVATEPIGSSVESVEELELILALIDSELDGSLKMAALELLEGKGAGARIGIALGVSEQRGSVLSAMARRKLSFHPLIREMAESRGIL